MDKFAWVTLATNDSYALGALVLAHSLKLVQTKHQLAVLITPGITVSMHNQLSNTFDVVQKVDVLNSDDHTNLSLLKRPELGVTFTKLHCWRLTQFEKCVFLDADTLVLQNSDELFEREELSAAADVGWPDCFNSGVFVFRPNIETFTNIIQFALKNGSFDGGDQGLLNLYFNDWAFKDISKRLPFVYNTCSTACYSYLPAFKQFSKDLKILHFIGQLKPWLLKFDSANSIAIVPDGYNHLTTYLQRWWGIFYTEIHSKLSDDMNLTTDMRQSAQLSSCNNNQNVWTNSSVYPQNKYLSNELKMDIEQSCIKTVLEPWDDYYRRNRDSNEIESQDSMMSNIPVSFPLVKECKILTDDPFQLITINHNKYIDEENLYKYSIVKSSLNNPAFEEHKSSIKSDVNVCDEIVSSKQLNTHELMPLEISFQDHISQFSNEGNLSSVPENDPKLFSFTETNQNVHVDRLYNFSLDNNNPCKHVLYAQDLSFSNSVKINEGGIAGALSQITLGDMCSSEQLIYEENIRQTCWESGNIDYLGKDSFENIWSHISRTLAKGSMIDDNVLMSEISDITVSGNTKNVGK